MSFSLTGSSWQTSGLSSDVCTVSRKLCVREETLRSVDPRALRCSIRLSRSLMQPYITPNLARYVSLHRQYITGLAAEFIKTSVSIKVLNSHVW